MTMHMAVMAMLESRGQANGMVEVRPVAYTNLALSVIFPTLAALMVGGRFYGRRLKRMTPGLDDWAILAALVLNFAQMTMSILRDVQGGFGLPTTQITPHQLKIQQQASFANDVFYPLVLTLSRVSITVLVIKIFSVSPLRWAAYANLPFCAVWCLFCIFTGLLRCRPLSKAWNPSPEFPGHCGDELQEIVKNAAWNMVCDLTTLAIPMAGTWQLQLTKGHKWGLTGVFALGLVLIGTAAARIGVSVVADKQDVSVWYNAARTNLSFAESSLSIAVACAPTLRPLFGAGFHVYMSEGASKHLASAAASRHARGVEFKGFENLPDAYELDERGRKKDSKAGWGYEGSGNQTSVDGRPVQDERGRRDWGWRREVRRERDESRSEQRHSDVIEVKTELSVLVGPV